MPFGRVGRLTEDAHTDQVKALTDADGHQADGAGNDPEPDDGDRGGRRSNRGWSGRPRRSSCCWTRPSTTRNYGALIEWGEGVLVPGYLAEPSADARWCHVGFEHPVAVARLRACWLAWQELTGQQGPRPRRCLNPVTGLGEHRYSGWH
ncbi:DUF4913 domain-containing protein [Streptomyces sp. NPDC006335]|uniref:DUF4913 domain-containing protein n=1 Tax=Streptomyces sp. NPDC006335 TaxID=3156895 RepID=UPI0033B16FC4